MSETKYAINLDRSTASLAELKNIAAKLLSPASALRMLILSEPDVLPSEEAIAKLEVFLRLLYQELAEGHAVRLNNAIN